MQSSSMGHICKIYEKDGWLFVTHYFTNSTFSGLMRQNLSWGFWPQGQVCKISSLIRDGGLSGFGRKLGCVGLDGSQRLYIFLRFTDP